MRCQLWTGASHARERPFGAAVIQQPIPTEVAVVGSALSKLKRLCPNAFDACRVTIAALQRARECAVSVEREVYENYGARDVTAVGPFGHRC